MKRKRYTEAQIAFCLRQAESGTPIARSPIRLPAMFSRLTVSNAPPLASAPARG